MSDVRREAAGGVNAVHRCAQGASGGAEEGRHGVKPLKRVDPDPESGGQPNPFTVPPPRRGALEGVGGIVAQQPEFD